MSPMMSPLLAILAAMLLFLGARGHMIMNTPKPYNFDIEPYLQVDPIAGNTFPYPCHNQYGFTSRTSVSAGSTTLVNFTGGGQHGGGSCQFSITYDEPVHGGDWNKSASFKTIYSIIGGCPAVFTGKQNTNLPADGMDANMRADSVHCGNDVGINCIREFNIPIPEFLKNGPATFAWTWFNKLGNKEMYMNCAPVMITNGTGIQSRIDALPDIFIANYPNDPEVPNCVTGYDVDKVVVNFPNPGIHGRIAGGLAEPPFKPDNYCTDILPAWFIPTFLADDDHRNSTPTVAPPVYLTTRHLTTTTTPSPAALPTTASDDEPVVDSVIPGPTSWDPPSVPPNSPQSPPAPPPEMDSMLAATTNTPHYIPVAVVTTTVTDVTNTVITTVTATAIGSDPASPMMGKQGPGPVTVPSVPASASPTSETAMVMAPSGVHDRPSENAVVCEINGVVVCLEQGTKWGMCNWGWVIPLDVAKGTICYWGRIVDVVDGGGVYNY